MTTTTTLQSPKPSGFDLQFCAVCGAFFANIRHHKKERKRYHQHFASPAVILRYIHCEFDFCFRRFFYDYFIIIDRHTLECTKKYISPLYGFHIRFNWNCMQIWVKSYYRSVCYKWSNALCLGENSTKTMPCMIVLKINFYSFRASNSFDFYASNAPTVHRHTSHTHT